MDHAAVVLEFRYDPAGGGLDRPRRVEAVLTLHPDGSGLLAHPLRRGPVDVAPVSWRREGERLEVDPGKIGAEGQAGLLAWETWSLELGDTDADSILDSGNGIASGQWDQMLGDVRDFARWEAEIETAPDTSPPVARLAYPDDRRPLPVDDRLLVSFSEPVAWEEDAVRLPGHSRRSRPGPRHPGASSSSIGWRRSRPRSRSRRRSPTPRATPRAGTATRSARPSHGFQLSRHERLRDPDPERSRQPGCRRRDTHRRRGRGGIGPFGPVPRLLS